MKKKVVITDYGFPDIEYERQILGHVGYEVVGAHCKNEDEVLELTRTAEAVMVQWAPITARVIERLENCKVIIRYGIGVDNIDLDAARARGIPVGNVPDYCIDEVADHSVAMALSLNRQLMTTDHRIRKGKWQITPPREFPPMREMMFATMGFGRIAREVLRRASVFGFKAAAFDPFVNREEMMSFGVLPLAREELLEQADVISLHLPLNKDTHHVINRDALQRMKPGALLINTARGGLIDTEALAVALKEGWIGGAGVDVFEQEPLPGDHPLLGCENALLTSHTAWYSSSSIPILQKMAAEEAVRGLKGEPLKNRVV